VNLPSTPKRIQVEEADERRPISESTIQKIGGSINWLLDNAMGIAIGSIDFSFLTEPQYQAINGTGFVLCDGRSVIGSTYNLITGQTNIPDWRGKYVRMKDHGAGRNPGGDLPLPSVSLVGSQQVQDIKGHPHNVVVSQPLPPGPPFTNTSKPATGGNMVKSGGDVPATDGSITTPTFAINNAGGTAEARHVRMYVYIRIN
jgi:hypothetical protein